MKSYIIEIDGYPTYKDWKPQGCQDSLYIINSLVNGILGPRKMMDRHTVGVAGEEPKL
jgi:hypothetical protein